MQEMNSLKGEFPEKPEVVIIGAGPAGMMLAYLLVTNGISVRVLERHPDFKREFRGEGIQPSVMAVLDELGFLPVLLEKGIAVPAQRAQIFLDEKPVITLGGLEDKDDDLIAEAPQGYLRMITEQFGEHTERQLLKVACDRMKKWSVPGMLFIGDAAHTMSPVAGQGINLAIRDSIVTANHLISAHRQGAEWDLALLEKIETERRPEVEELQSFQIRLGHLMLGAPRWQTRLVFRKLMPVLTALGIQQHYVRRIQGGKTEVKLQSPVTYAEATCHTF